MFALVKKYSDTVEVVAVSEKTEPLMDLLKKEATNYAMMMCYDDEEEFEETGFKKTIAEAIDYWTDEDDESPFEIYIEGAIPLI